MDPFTIAIGFAALVGLGTALRMRERARRAESELARLRARRQRAPARAVPNERPWRGPHRVVRRPPQPH